VHMRMILDILFSGSINVVISSGRLRWFRHVECEDIADWIQHLGCTSSRKLKANNKSNGNG